MSVRRLLSLSPVSLGLLLILIAPVAACADEVSFKVKTTAKTPDPDWLQQHPYLFSRWTLLTVRRAKVLLSNGYNAADFEMSCSDFLESTKNSDGTLELKRGLAPPLYITVKEKGVTSSAALKRISEVCGTQGEEAHRLQLQREDDARFRAEQERKEAIEEDRWWADEHRRREDEAAKRAAEFRDGIHAALRAAEEPDPFSSIRGDFDLAAPDSRQWKTSFMLLGAARCDLLKTPAPAPAGGSVWTLACLFRASQDRYEEMVKSVQTVLDVPYQPDEQAPTNVNQVFFADPSRPAWRLFVTRLNEATVGVSIVATRLASATSTVPNAAVFPTIPSMPPPEATVHDEVEKIRAGRYAPMPPAQRSAESGSSVSGRTAMNIKNSTTYELSLFFDGAVSKKLTLAPGASRDLELAPGTFHVAGRVAAANVLPFYSEETYASSASYTITFYIGRRH